MNKITLLSSRKQQRPMVIDFFAGGGGASVGIEMATGKQVDLAINHDIEAIRMHSTNHPSTTHVTEDIFKVDLGKYIKGRQVGLIWASPTCTHFSKAKGGKPLDEQLRILPWSVYKHVKNLDPKPTCIMENVVEIQDWGPLDESGRPIKERMGEYFQEFIHAMESLGYHYESRELVAADYGAPTTRKRWFGIFRADGKPIVWPEPTHSKNGENGLEPWVPASTVLNLGDFGSSIFGRKKPLAEKTMKRIAAGIDKFVLSCEEPFLVQVNHAGDRFRGQSIHEPMPTITQKHGFGLVTAKIVDAANLGIKKGQVSGNHSVEAAEFLTKFYKSGIGQSMDEPLHTITTSPGHFGQVSVITMSVEDLKRNGISEEEAKKCTWVSQFLTEYYGNGIGSSLHEPVHTVVTKDRFALITVLGTDQAIMDICLRMLEPEELKLAQGFPKDYIINRDMSWTRYPKSKQVARIGNSVVPILAKVLVEANCPELIVCERVPCLNVSEEDNGQLCIGAM
ncbi:DNA cytosine methyltransferase [Eubacterium ramulus]|uniref:DNA cytosine methyltransferase n=1 Tax=Eubacterium ramulus TaxID=39490 RepID=UPI0022E898E3|nr:DNA cytosine methyltransferase [Eubacterium ramulus]